jgi:CheY-like chemotaxis protein
MDKKRVLVVEDEAAIAKLIALLIAETGAVAETAGNGAEALQKLAKHKPDLLIVDLIMPVMSGEELIQEVQGNPELADIPIVLLTTRQSAAGYKRDEFPLISKPFEPAQVREVVKQVLGLD